MPRTRPIKITADTAPRCMAKTRSGQPCMAPVVRSKKRCRMHGGAHGSGAPKGNQNRLVHGRYTAAAIEMRRTINALMRQARQTAQDV